jgi:hypothetical protein
MIKRYKSDYSNEVHQLVVSPSKHFYVTSKGTFKYQKKSFEVNLETISSTKKLHIIHYLIRDHFSGLFYWELCPSIEPISICDFLFRAWSKKERNFLYGIPEYLTIPKNTQVYFPNLLNFIEKLSISYIKVTSGFQGGVRDIKTIEDRLRYAGFDYNNPSTTFPEEPEIDLVLERAPEICRRLSDSSYRKPSKKDIWLSGIEPDQKIFIPKSLETFKEAYYSTRTQPGAQDGPGGSAPLKEIYQ